MRRREFMAGLAGAVAWPLAAQAQQAERMRRIGLLLSATADDAEFQVWVGAFLQGLAILGWTLGGNLRIDTRWAGTNAADIHTHAAELVELQPEVILAHGTSSVTPLLQITRTVPVVFVSTTDPVGAGLVNSFTRPGGNATGFMAFEYSLSAKWLELLKRVTPDVMRVAALRESGQGSGTNYFAVIQAVAPLLKVEVSPVNTSDVEEIERAITIYSRAPNGGLVVTPSPAARQHSNLIVKLTAQHRLAAVYPYRYFMAGGGLISYGPNQIDQYRRAAGYVDRILKGEKPFDLPVQSPAKYETLINLKTAKALGLTIPETLLATADEVIQ